MNKMSADSKENPPVDSPPPFPIVAIGFSAGGLPALEAFFDAIPADFRACYLVASHFPQDRETHLAELLRNHTRLEVENASPGVPLESGRVWILPPGRLFECRDNLLLEAERQHPASAAPILIDTLLHSLARHDPERGIAVILSGTGSDGAAATRAMAAAGVWSARPARDRSAP